MINRLFTIMFLCLFLLFTAIGCSDSDSYKDIKKREIKDIERKANRR